jgi:hypothetical protein
MEQPKKINEQRERTLIQEGLKQVALEKKNKKRVRIKTKQKKIYKPVLIFTQSHFEKKKEAFYFKL